MNKKALNKKLNSIKKRAMNIATWCWATLPRKIISCLVIAGILLSSMWLLLLKPKPVEASWWDEDWLYRKSVPVTNNTTAETDAYISFDNVDGRPFINTSGNNFQADCGDLRFTKRDGTQLDYYIVSGCGGASTIVHVKLDMLQTGDQTIYFYYGNPSADNGFIGTDFPTEAEASDYDIGEISLEETGIGPVLWLKFDEGYGAFAYNSTSNDAGKLPGTQLDTSHPLANGLVGLWLMNEGTGDEVADLSENGNTGTFQGTSPSWTSGKFGSAVSLPGTNEYIDISSFQGISSSAPFSVIIWLKQITHDANKGIISIKNTAASKCFEILTSTDASYRWITFGSEDDAFPRGRINVDISSEIASQWNQLVFVHLGGGTDADYITYWNGNEISRTGIPSALGDVGNVSYIGKLGTGAYYWNGSLDNVSIFNRALSASEIAQLYTEPFAMISDTGASRISSGASWTDFGKFNKALDFDGTEDGIVTVIRDASVNLQNKSAYSISTWIYPHSDGGGNVGEIIDKGANTYIRVDSEGSDGYLDLEAKLDLVGGDDPLLNIENALRINRWSHILLVWENDGDDEFTIYVNGIDMGTSSGGSGDPEDDSGSDLLIGGSANVNFDGIIDEVIIYPYARSAVQAKRNYNQGASARIGRDDSWITDGLVGYWKMDESNGTASDSSGAGITLSNAGTATFTGGKFANGTSLNGSSQYFHVADNTTLSITGDIVLSAWVYANSVSGTDVIVGKWDGSNETYLLSLEGGKPRMYIDSSSNYQTTDSATVSTSTWTLVTGTYDASAGKVRLYIDGREENSSTTGTIPTSIGDDAGVFHIGAEDFTGGAANFFEGKIDDVRVYNRELSGFEVMRLYDWGPPPIGHWTFDKGSGSTVYDSSENSNDGTLEGNPTWKGSAECKFGNCLDFDGDGDYVSGTTPIVSGTYTFCYWLRPNVITGTYGVVSFQAGYNTPGGFGSTISSSKVYSFVKTSHGWKDIDTPIAVNKWYYICSEWNGIDLTLYKNGVIANSVGRGGSLGYTNSELEIGYDSYPLGYFNGTIDDVKIYNYARTQKQIIEDMMGGRPAITETTSSPGVTMGYWKFDEGFGTTAYDGSGRSNNLTHSAEAYTMSGKFGKAWDGDGAKWLSRNDDPDFDFTGTEDFSISGWFKHSPISADEYIIAKYQATIAGGYKVYMDLDGDIVFAIDDDGTWDTEDVIGNDQGRNYDDNAWHYFAAVKRGTSSTRLYVDGREIDNDTSLTENDESLANGASLYVGRNSNEADAFDGELDEIKIYRFALSPEEILLDYNKGKSVIMGAVGTEDDGTTPSWSQSRAYCPPGFTGTCDPPVGEWKMDERADNTCDDSNNDVCDTSGNTNHGAISGASWKGSADCKYGNCLDFDGDGDYVDLTAVDVTDTAGSISAWVKFDDVTTQRRALVSWGSTNVDDTFAANVRLSKDDDDPPEVGNAWIALRIIDDDASTNNTIISTTTGIATGNWYHVVVTSNGSAYHIYVNGVDQTLNAVGGSNNGDWIGDLTLPTGTTKSAIGAGFYKNNYDTEIDGIIDHVMIFDYAMTQEQVAWVYNRGKPIGHWKMDEGEGSTAKDSSENNNSGTITDATWTASGKYNSALSFDGTGDYVDVGDISGIDLATELSVSAWIKPALSGTEIYVSKWDTTPTTDKTFFMRVYNTGQLEFEVHEDNSYGSDYTAIFSSTNLTANTWNHIVMTFKAADASGLRIYVNGIEDNTPVSTSSITALEATTIPVTIGIDNEQNYDFDGIIDEVKIYNYALTQEQIKIDYNQGAALRFGD